MTLYKRALFKRIKDKYAPDEVDKLALLIILAFLTIFGIMGCIEAYASDEEPVTENYVQNLYMSSNQNYFSTGSQSISYFEIEKGYIYHITNNWTYNINCAFSNDIPAVNVNYYDFFNLTPGDTYSFIADNNNYFYFNNQKNSSIVVTREKMTGQGSAVSDLVDNVGINQIWNIFDISIEYIVIVVAVAFGIFLIVLAIRKVTKGKSEF